MTVVGARKGKEKKKKKRELFRRRVKTVNAQVMEMGWKVGRVIQMCVYVRVEREREKSEEYWEGHVKEGRGNAATTATTKNQRHVNTVARFFFFLQCVWHNLRSILLTFVPPKPLKTGKREAEHYLKLLFSFSLFFFFRSHLTVRC